MGIPPQCRGGPPWLWHSYKRSLLLLCFPEPIPPFPLPGTPCAFGPHEANRQVLRQGRADRGQPWPGVITEPEWLGGCGGGFWETVGPCLVVSRRPLALDLSFFLGEMGTFCRLLFPACCKDQRLSLGTILPWGGETGLGSGCLPSGRGVLRPGRGPPGLQDPAAPSSGAPLGFISGATSCR